MEKDNRINNLIVITGISSQGKTYISVDLKKRFGYYIIHTDQFYRLNRLKGSEKQNLIVGEESDVKEELLKSYLPDVTETTIIEGSHIGNQKELDIFIKGIKFEGNIYKFIVDSSNIKKQFQSKHKETSKSNWIGINKWFEGIYDLKDVIEIEFVADLVKFLKIDNEGIIRLSR